MTKLETLPLYQCHKRVRAAKIVNIVPVGVMEAPAKNGGAVLHLDGGGFVHVGTQYMNKHLPVCGGYFVVYEEGYQSFSPAKAFEDGYTLAVPALLQPQAGFPGVDIDAAHKPRFPANPYPVAVNAEE